MHAILERATRSPALDRLADQVEGVAKRLHLDQVSETTQRWIGHPLHPVLTDLPIGFWTSAWVLDNIGGRRRSAAAQTLLGLGVLSAVPTAATGLGDIHYLKGSARRVAVVHAAANSIALALAGVSWVVGRRRHRGMAITLNWLSAGAATVGGYLGGELAFNPSDDDDEGAGATKAAKSAGASKAPARTNGAHPPANAAATPPQS